MRSSRRRINYRGLIRSFLILNVIVVIIKLLKENVIEHLKKYFYISLLISRNDLIIFIIR